VSGDGVQKTLNRRNSMEIEFDDDEWEEEEEETEDYY